MLRIRLKAHENGAGQSRIISVIEILERGDFFWTARDMSVPMAWGRQKENITGMLLGAV